MTAIDRTNWTALVDDNGSGNGTRWSKDAIKTTLLDPIDTALGTIDTKDAAQDTIQAAAVANTRLVDRVLLRPELQSFRETKSAPTIASGVLTLNMDNGNHFNVSLNASITSVTLSNTTAGQAWAMNIAFTADGTQRTITWPAGVRWSQGNAPTMTATLNKIDLVTLYAPNGGTTVILGFISQNH
jgi:hypothetical protein